MKPLFTRELSSVYRFVFFVVLALAMILVDHHFNYLQPLRSWIGYFSAPVYKITNSTRFLSDWAEQRAKSREDLDVENKALRDKVLLLERRLQKLAALTAENVRLRELLNSSALVSDTVLIAEIIGLDPDPFRHEIVLDKGEKDGVILGQPILDASGLMGQIIEVGPLTSRALLITDVSHATPVMVNRNGVRAIAVGGGKLDRLTLTYVPETADIKVGDLLVSSGLGGRFPSGYPVGVVTRVEHDGGQPFAVVEARPTSQLDRVHHVLLVFQKQPEPRQPKAQPAPVKEEADETKKKEAAKDKADKPKEHEKDKAKPAKHAAKPAESEKKAPAKPEAH
ncbi:MAG TPA: rod shape-determining protein MreC [Pseudomonadales bacterium]|nr:rod shape-determining protein MreC [Pseudomonadales bacterium]